MQRGFRGREVFDAGNGVGHDDAKLGDGRVGIAGGLRDQPIERQAGELGGMPELFELAARFIEVTAEALQVLLHELWYLGKNHCTEDAEHTVQQAFAGTEEALGGFHSNKSGGADEATQAGRRLSDNVWERSDDVAAFESFVRNWVEAVGSNRVKAIRRGL